MGTSLQPLAGLLYLSSPALPIGAFAYSQGLEAAIEQGRVTDKASLHAWVSSIIEHGFMKLDIPLLNQATEAIANRDSTRFFTVNAEVFAARESFELYEEERLLGAALFRLLRTQKLLDDIDDWQPESGPLSFLAVFALAAQAMSVPPSTMRLGLIWSWLENQMAVAAKAIPLGQTDTQFIMLKLLPDIVVQLESTAAESTVPSGSLPGQAMLSAWHENQYSRLFRS